MAKKGFVLITKDATKEQQDRILEAVKSPFGFSWWHWFPQTWIFIDLNGLWTAAGIRDHILQANPGLTFYLFQMNSGSDYAGYAPPEWENWLKENWAP